ncbi:hypothetical protein GGI43DRAFT_118220 [Trichoderma evansii]
MVQLLGRENLQCIFLRTCLIISSVSASHRLGGRIGLHLLLSSTPKTNWLPFQQQHHHLNSLHHSLLHSEHRTTTWFPAPLHTSVCLHAASGVSRWRYTDRGLITWEHEVPYSLACLSFALVPAADLRLLYLNFFFSFFFLTPYLGIWRS